MSLLNKLSLNQIVIAIKENDKKLIGSVQGIGQKMTERIVLELKSKIMDKVIEKENFSKKKFILENKDLNSILEDIDLTLQSLNYPKKEIKNLFPKLINDIKQKNLTVEDDSISFEYLLKNAMNYLEKK